MNKYDSFVAKITPWGLWLGNCFLFSTLSFAAYSHRTFLIDGSFWYFTIINNHETMVDSSYFRYFNYLVQWPAVVLLKNSQSDVTALALRVLEFSHCLLPFLSIALTALILRLKKRMDLILFPLLSFGLATMSTAAFTVGSVPNALAVFWPLYCLFLTRKANSVFDTILIIVLSGFLSITYEAVFMFYLLMLIVLLLQPRDSKIARFNFYVLALCFSAFGGYLLFRAFGPAAGSKEGLIASLKGDILAFRIYSFVVLAGICISALPLVIKLTGKRSGLLWPLQTLITILASAMFIFHLAYRELSIGDTYNARVTAIPVAALIAALMLAYYLKTKSDPVNHPDKKFLTGLAPIVVLVLLAAGMYDLAVTRQGSRGVRYLNSLLAEHKGCYKVARKDYLAHLAFYGFADWSLPFSSILLAEKKDVETIIFTEREEGSFESFDPCRSLKDDILKNDDGYHIPVGPGQHFNYQKFLGSLPQQ